MKCLLFSVILVLYSSLLIAQDLSGKWKMNANGFTYILTIWQEGNNITIKQESVNSDERTSTFKGTITHGKFSIRIEMTRSNGQAYLGFINTEYETKNKTMAGVFGNGDGKWKWGWYATKIE